MCDAASLPCFRSRLPRRRHRPEAPHLFAGGLIKGGEEAAHAFVATGRAGDHEVADHERRARGVVVLTPVRHLRFPQQRTRRAVERDDVRMIGHHEHAIARDGDASVDTAGRVADEPLGSWTRIVPDPASRSGVDRVTLICARDVHHAVHDDRCHLQRRGIRKAEGPLRYQPPNIALVDLRQLTVAASCRLPVVAGPVAF